ncbi:site-specific integrase [Maribacter polysaccharolyticus]|uniref:site-specific integrase n=1 Tax=Maribacter polysaccharolyticus TaxID=3020831 RepID=UPI00237F4770|nr:site-specific integrase [Maribacter polysaccharolyticus]MDE3744094.1 site-specific integrase [Maribacter polysaccharolyticus]
MRTTSTFSILFWTYAGRAKNNKTNIYARITVNGKKINISLKAKVNVNAWDSKRQKSKGNSVESRTVNLYLDEVKADLVQCYRDLKQDNRVLSPQLIKARYLGEDKKVHSLLDIFDYHNETLSNKLSAKTLCHYRTSQKYILAFVAKNFKATDRYLRDLDYAFVLSFESFLRSYQPKHYQGKIGNNAVMKHIQRLRKMVTLAYHLEWIERDPFVKFKPKLEKREREFLTDSELESIRNLKPNIERLSVVKDLFIFSCYTGISYGDIIKLNKDHIVQGADNNYWIMATRNKNGNPFKIPLLPIIESLIQKYEEHPRTRFTGSLMPNISNQRLNSYLKEIADLCGIKKNLTFHMARHTFATTVTLSNGVPIETVSKLLGHNKLSTTQIYARVIEKKVSEDMNALRERLK